LSASRNASLQRTSICWVSVITSSLLNLSVSSLPQTTASPFNIKPCTVQPYEDKDNEDEHFLEAMLAAADEAEALKQAEALLMGGGEEEPFDLSANDSILIGAREQLNQERTAECDTSVKKLRGGLHRKLSVNPIAKRRLVYERLAPPVAPNGRASNKYRFCNRNGRLLAEVRVCDASVILTILNSLTTRRYLFPLKSVEPMYL
jgi:hypothetical protein